MSDKAVFPSPYALDDNQGLSLRQLYAAMAPASEIESMTPDKASECERYLGIPAGTYMYLVHYPQLLAKARFIWADAMIRASKEACE